MLWKKWKLMKMWQMMLLVVISNIFIILIELALFNLGVNSGEVIGPFIGGYFTQTKSFDTACIFTSLLSLAYTLGFSILNIKAIKTQLFPKKDILVEEDEYHLLKPKVKREEKVEYVVKFRAMSHNTRKSSRTVEI
jgi:hypothetical protein